MILCTGWNINDVFVPFADSRQGQPNGVATLDSTGQSIVQDEESPQTYATELNWSSDNATKTSKYVTHLLLPID